MKQQRYVGLDVSLETTLIYVVLMNSWFIEFSSL